jgi:hypothetical protein
MLDEAGNVCSRLRFQLVDDDALTRRYDPTERPLPAMRANDTIWRFFSCKNGPGVQLSDHRRSLMSRWAGHETGRNHPEIEFSIFYSA